MKKLNFRFTLMMLVFGFFAGHLAMADQCYWDWFLVSFNKWEQTQFCPSNSPCICEPSIAPIESSPICITHSERRCGVLGCRSYTVCVPN